jgi:uncharacterized protein YdhG (YjbR/CyaY superfamily)
MRAKPRTIDEYLEGVSPDKRAALEQLRRTIMEILPRAEECISYQIPGFRLDGRVVCWMGAAKNHCSFFPGGIVDEMEDELSAYETSKGTVRFQPDAPLPVGLVRRLIVGRLARDQAKATARRLVVTSPARRARLARATARPKAR